MHKLSEAAIEHPRFVLVATILVLLLAVFAGFSTSVQRTPAITTAVILVAIPHPDAKPDEAEDQITRKVEEALTDLQGVDFMASTSMRGSSVTQILFLDGVEPDSARREVKDLVDRIRNELPLGREVQPIVTDIDFESMPLMLVTLTGPPGYDNRSLKQIAEDAQKELETVDGVSNTQVFGGREREIHVNVNPYLATQYGLTLADFRAALANFHAKVPAGAQNTGVFDLAVRNETQFDDIDDIREAIVGSFEGKVIRMSDVAEVVDSHRRVKNLAQLDSRDCATIIVNKEADINTLGAAKAIKAKVEELREKHPDIQFAVTRDTSEEISIMFRVLGSSAVFGAMLVLIILAWSMGFRISLLVLLAVPLSSAVALVFLYASGIPVSNMVLFSYILVLGMVVDGAIIVAENIHRHIERGEDPMTAAKVGIHEVGIPVLAADLTTVAAFLPMLLVPGIMGDFMGVMPKVVSAALIGSVMVDHFVIPTLAARWYKKRETKHDEAATFAKITVGDSSEILPHQGRVRPNLGPFTRAYASMLRWSLSHRWAVMLSIGVAIWSASILFHHIDFVFFPESDRGQFSIKYELPLGYSIHESVAASRVFTEPLERMRREGRVKHYVSALGSSQALASRLENDPAVGPEFGQIMVQLESPLDRDWHETSLVEELRNEIRPWPDMKYEINRVKEGPPGGSPVAVRLTGDHLKQLGEVSQWLVAQLKETRGTIDVTTDYRPESPELVIEPKPDVVGLFSMTEMQIARATQTAIAGDMTHQLTLDDEDVTIRLQLAPEFQRWPDDLKQLMLTSPSGQKATIGQLADVYHEVGLYAINRWDRERAVMARCNLLEGTVPDDVFGKLRDDLLPKLGFRAIPPDGGFVANLLRAIGLSPPKQKAMEFLGSVGTPSEGIRAKFTGENEERDKNFGYLVNSMVIGVILIFAVLVLQFNSFRQCFVVLVTVPLSFVGVMAGLVITGLPFSLATFIGLVSLTGVVVNDAIVLVDFANQARKRALPVKEALIEAGVNRLRPVILTTVTTIGGLMPLFLNISGGAEFWQPLTGAVIFGLSFATVLTLVVIPVCYSLVYFRVGRQPAVAEAAG